MKYHECAYMTSIKSIDTPNHLLRQMYYFPHTIAEKTEAQRSETAFHIDRTGTPTPEPAVFITLSD